MSDVTPNDMPGASEAAEVTESAAVTADTTEAPEKGLPPEKLAELNRTLRNERKAAEKKAREAEAAKAEADKRWQQLAELFGGKDGKVDDFDPKAAIADLQSRFESERTARLRSDVARETGVDPEDIHGSTEEEMRASAERWTQRFNQRLDEALKAKNVPAAPPASTVTSDGKITGPEQITSKDQLAKLSPADRMKAYRDGRLDGLLGKST
jgi:hypothetical protein